MLASRRIKELLIDDVVLVTGGLGSVGSYVCLYWVDSGKRPLVVDRRDDRSLIRDIEDQCIVACGDILETESIRSLLDQYRPTAIAHLASMVGPRVESEPFNSFSVNVV